MFPFVNKFKNKKDIMFFGIFIVIFILVAQFIYFPKLKNLNRLRLAHSELKGEIEHLYDFVGGKKNLEENIINMRKQSIELQKFFSSEKEVANIIKRLNEQLKQSNIDVISLKPGEIEHYRNREDKELQVAGYTCKRMKLTLNVTARYQALGKFLISLENTTPRLTVERVRIDKDEDIIPKIAADIELVAYILGN